MTSLRWLRRGKRAHSFKVDQHRKGSWGTVTWRSATRRRWWRASPVRPSSPARAASTTLRSRSPMASPSPGAATSRYALDAVISHRNLKLLAKCNHCCYLPAIASHSPGAATSRCALDAFGLPAVDHTVSPGDRSWAGSLEVLGVGACFHGNVRILIIAWSEFAGAVRHGLAEEQGQVRGCAQGLLLDLWRVCCVSSHNQLAGMQCAHPHTLHALILIISAAAGGMLSRIGSKSHASVHVQSCCRSRRRRRWRVARRSPAAASSPCGEFSNLED